MVSKHPDYIPYFNYLPTIPYNPSIPYHPSVSGIRGLRNWHQLDADSSYWQSPFHRLYPIPNPNLHHTTMDCYHYSAAHRTHVPWKGINGYGIPTPAETPEGFTAPAPGIGRSAVDSFNGWLTAEGYKIPELAELERHGVLDEREKTLAILEGRVLASDPRTPLQESVLMGQEAKITFENAEVGIFRGWAWDEDGEAVECWHVDDWRSRHEPLPHHRFLLGGEGARATFGGLYRSQRELDERLVGAIDEFRETLRDEAEALKGAMPETLYRVLGLDVQNRLRLVCQRRDGDGRPVTLFEPCPLAPAPSSPSPERLVERVDRPLPEPPAEGIDKPLPKAPVEDDSDDDVDEDGWEAVWDTIAQRPYFVNLALGITQWENPRVPKHTTEAAVSGPSTPKATTIEDHGPSSWRTWKHNMEKHVVNRWTANTSSQRQSQSFKVHRVVRGAVLPRVYDPEKHDSNDSMRRLVRKVSSGMGKLFRSGSNRSKKPEMEISGPIQPKPPLYRSVSGDEKDIARMVALRNQGHRMSEIGKLCNEGIRLTTIEMLVSKGYSLDRIKAVCQHP